MKRILISFCLILFGIGIVYGVHADDKEMVTSLKYVNDALATKQDEIGAQNGTAAVTFTDTAGVITATTVTGTLGNSTSDTSLPMVGGVNTKLATKQDEIPAKNTNKVLTYTGTAGQIGEKGIYQDSGTYASQSDNLIDAGTFNAALKNGLDNEFVCAGYATTGECWLWSVDNDAPTRSPNLFDISKVPTRGLPSRGTIVNNGDGSITVTTTPTNGAVTSDKTLSQLAPGLEVGKTYTLSFKTTGTDRHIYLRKDASNSTTWHLISPTRTMTQDLLDSTVYFYASGVSTTATISDIQIEEGATATPYVPYGNVYVPQNQSAQNQ